MSSQLTPQDTLREVPVAGRTYLVYDPIPSLLAEERQRTVDKIVQSALQEQAQSSKAFAIPTQVIIDHFFKVRAVEGLSGSADGEVPEKQTKPTWAKKFAQIAHSFPVLPDDLEPYLEYLSQFKGPTGRHKQNHYDALNMLLRHVVQFFGMRRNPLEGMRRPRVEKQPINPLDLSQVAVVNKTPEDITETAALHMLLHHGWRPIEVRRITAGDIRRGKDVILCRGKERIEDICILPETLAILHELTLNSLSDDQVVIRSRRIRNGGSEPLGEDGLRDLINQLYKRAGLEFKPYDLRRTFGTLFREASKDYELTERIMRHTLPGAGPRYIKWPMTELAQALQTYSPLRLIQRGEFDSPPSPPA